LTFVGSVATDVLWLLLRFSPALSPPIFSAAKVFKNFQTQMQRVVKVAIRFWICLPLSQVGFPCYPAAPTPSGESYSLGKLLLGKTPPSVFGFRLLFAAFRFPLSLVPGTR